MFEVVLIQGPKGDQGEPGEPGPPGETPAAARGEPGTSEPGDDGPDGQKGMLPASCCHLVVLTDRMSHSAFANAVLKINGFLLISLQITGNYLLTLV
jgi:hypothetical protein